MNATEAPTDVEAVFSVYGRGLYLSGGALGRRIRLDRGGVHVMITLPDRDQVFSLVNDPWRGIRAHLAWQSSEGEVWAATVTEFEVRVDMRRDGEEHVRAVLGRAFPVAAGAVESFVAWIRTRGRQYWLPSWYDGFIDLSRAKLVYARTDTEVVDRRPWNPPMTAFGRSREEAVTPEELDYVISALQADEAPPDENVLLADAQAVLRNPGPARRDTARAVLLAAMAAEKKIKATLVAKAPEELHDLLDILLENPRDVSIATGQLLDKPLKAVLGVSLREQDTTLFKDVTDKTKTRWGLFPLRNRVAHYAYKPDPAQAEHSVGTAVRLFAWLDAL